MSSATQLTRYGQNGYIGLDWMPYQVAFGLSIRRLEGWHLRLYIGPLKLYGGQHESL